MDDLAHATTDLDASFRSLEASIDARLDADAREITTLRARLKTILRAALTHGVATDGDDRTPWLEIVSVAIGDAHWPQRIQAQYGHDHARLVQHCRKLFGYITDSVGLGLSAEQIAVGMANHLEQELLPEMVLAENGRTFQRSVASTDGRSYETAIGPADISAG